MTIKSFLTILFNLINTFEFFVFSVFAQESKSYLTHLNLVTRNSLRRLLPSLFFKSVLINQ